MSMKALIQYFQLLIKAAWHCINIYIPFSADSPREGMCMRGKNEKEQIKKNKNLEMGQIGDKVQVVDLLCQTD